MVKFKNLCVYCGSSNGPDKRFVELAEQLGSLIGANGHNLVYGGGRLGLMGIVASSTMQSGGKAIGYIPSHLDSKEGANTDLDELHIVDSMHTRKMRMSERADAFLILPGGFGTLDELFEIITWRQLSLHNKPIIVINAFGYWSKLEELFKQVIDNQFALEQHRSYVCFIDSIDQVLETLEECPAASREFDSRLA